MHARHQIAPRLYVLLDGASSDGILNDASEGGVALDIVGPKPEGETLLLDFEMSETGQRFEATGRITWADESGRKVGVNFVDLPDESRRRIREWLAVKASLAAPARPLQPAVVQDVAREATRRPEISPSSGRNETELNRGTGDHQQSNGAIAATDAGKRDAGDRLVRELVESYANRREKENPKFARVFTKARDFISRQHLRKWLMAAAAAFLVVFLAFGVGARRSPEPATGLFNLSKAGKRANPGFEAASVGANGEEGQESGSQAGGGNIRGNGDGTGGGLPGSPLSIPAMMAPLSGAGRPPCVKLGAASDKIRVYLWVEQDTPEAIGGVYAKHLKAVPDVRVVDKAPYDLVLYVNGAAVDAKGPAGGFIWSSRVFRPWYCGEALGLLEQTQVNESLHYAQGSNLNQRVQAEIAYLILHSFEGIRNDRGK